MRRFKRVSVPTTSGVCFCCLRQDDGIGVAGNGRGFNLRVAWSCEKHAHLGKKAFAMSGQEFNRIEVLALGDAGEIAGAYLDQINCSDLAKLTPEEWTEFCRTMVQAFGDAMEARLAAFEAPF